MGIDKPNVRFTVNMNYSSSLESFVQEAGRAGRDRGVALSTILFSDYKLARISKRYKNNDGLPWKVIKDRWFYAEDLVEILNFYNITLTDDLFDYYTPKHDLIKLQCEKKNKANRNIYAENLCKVDCKDNNCSLLNAPRILSIWQYEKDFNEIVDNLGIKVSQKNINYHNSDFQNMMFFFNGSFKGEIVELDFMNRLLNEDSTEIFSGENREGFITQKKEMKGFLSTLIQAKVGERIVSFAKYIKGKDDTDIAKAIYRMTSIGLIEDFTQDYVNERYRIVSIRKSEGEYFEGLKSFLLRYYAPDRADNEINKAKQIKLEIEHPNSLRNEIQRCLSYLTEFVYEKISVKRKRSINDIRNFCIQGIDKDKDWKETNEDLKDYIYYYFNSKYAKEDYVADNGEPYSLTIDTDGGKISSEDILFKYLKVVDDDLVGSGTEIDNVKHLQGAVRLIRRSLTDTNPSLALLNAFTLLFLGTNNNENLILELENSYIDGMVDFSERIKESQIFWDMFEDFNKLMMPYIKDQNLFSELKLETELAIHSKRIKNITEKYLG
jgi:hypothetical protein